MKTFLVMLLLVISLCSPTPSWADTDQSSLTVNNGYLQQDVLFKDTKTIYDKDGRRTGQVKQDPIFSNTKIIYDRDGRKIGYIKQDPLFKDTKVIYDKNGRKKGYLRKDPLFKDRTNIDRR